MKFLLLIYNDPAKLEAIKGERFNAEMRDGRPVATEAVRIAGEFPWVRTGCGEVRPVRDVETVRQRVAQN